MDFKVKLGLLFFVTFVPFIGYLANPLLAFNDSYAFASQVCGREVAGELGSFFFKSFVLPLFPCNFFVIKFVLWLFFFGSVLAIWGAARNVVGSGKGFRVAFVSATLSPLLFFEVMKFENDIFGWFLGLIGFWCVSTCFALPNRREFRLKRITSIILACMAWFFAMLVYIPSILIGIALAFSLLFLLLPASLAVWWFFPKIWGYLQPSKGLVSEEMLGFGIPWIALMLPFIFDLPKKLRLTTIFLLIAGFIKAKFMVLAVPFLAFGVVEADEKFKHHKWWPNLIIVGLVFSCAYSFMAFQTAPTTQDFELYKQGIKLAQDLNAPLYNDWEYGWHLWYLGYDTNYKAGYPQPDYNHLPRPFIAITKEEIPCARLAQVGERKTYYC